MQKTNIDYLTHTWNPIAMRCTRVSPGCASCWHLRMADRLAGNPKLPIAERDALSGKGPFILRERELEASLKLRKPAVIGVQFMGDLFHEDVPYKFKKKIIEFINVCPKHIFLILTKRPVLMKKFFDDLSYAPYNQTAVDEFECYWRNELPLKNTWLGLTICTQQEADEKLPIFLQVPGKKFISFEPALEEIDLNRIKISRSFSDSFFPALKNMGGLKEMDLLTLPSGDGISWVVAGAETGPRARPCELDWLRSIRDQCQAAGVPFWLKQTDKKGNRLLDGKEHNERPFESK